LSKGLSGEAVERIGTLVHDGAGFALATDAGERLHLILPRVPVDLVEKRVRVTGRLTAPTLLDADGVAPA